jgi:hypothetical protein
VFASQTMKKNQIAMLTAAAALYGLIKAPGTGPFDFDSAVLCVVFSRALTEHHIASSDNAAARQTRSCKPNMVSKCHFFFFWRRNSLKRR